MEIGGAAVIAEAAIAAADPVAVLAASAEGSPEEDFPAAVAIGAAEVADSLAIF